MSNMTRTFKNGDYPEVAARWSNTLNSVSPEDVLSGASRTKYFFTCDEGHAYDMTPKDATRKGRNCPFCAGVKVLQGFNDLSTTHPEVAADFSPDNELSPDELTAGSNQPVKWTSADCGHTWDAAVKTRVRGSKCPFCSGQRILIGFNDTATQYPSLVQDYSASNEKSLEELTPGSNFVARWVCHHCAHVWTTQVLNRARRGSGCPSCGTGRNAPRKGH